MSVNWSEIISSGIEQFENDLESLFASCDERIGSACNQGDVVKNAAYYFAQGEILKHQCKYRNAIAQYDKAIALKADYPEAYLQRGLLYKNLGDLGNAIADLNQTLELDPEQSQAYFPRGAAAAYVGNFDQAIADFSKLIETNATANGYYNRGVVYYQTADYEKAIADLQKVVEVEPDFLAAYLNLGNAYYALDNQTEAQKNYDLAKAIEGKLSPRDEHGYYAQGIAATNQSLPAKEYFSKAAAIASRNNNYSLSLKLASAEYQD
ncbi:MAG: tetratricopeptide repeat protein [Cyanobacteria bacterium J06643_13]